jgi:Putative auto-transporter adhesin, head GIN domain
MKKVVFLAGVVFSVLTQSFAQTAVSKKSYVVETSEASNITPASEKSYAIGTSETLANLRIEGNINVRLLIAPNVPNVYVQGSESFSKAIKTSLSHKTMTITADVSSKSDNDVVIIYAPSLEMLELNGDIKLNTVGTVDSEKLKVFINGNCRLTVQHAGKLNIKVDDEYELTERKITKL